MKRRDQRVEENIMGWENTREAEMRIPRQETARKGRTKPDKIRKSKTTSNQTRQGKARPIKARTDEARQYRRREDTTRGDKAIQSNPIRHQKKQGDASRGKKRKTKATPDNNIPESQSRDMNESHGPEITHKQAKRTAILP